MHVSIILVGTLLPSYTLSAETIVSSLTLFHLLHSVASLFLIVPVRLH